LINNSDVERNRIANDRLKLTDINAQIASIQNKINTLQKQQTTFEGLIRKSEATITDNDNQIAEIRLRVDGFQSEIGRLADRTDTIKSQVRDL
jgi:chromosome segregation ATPase